MASFTRLSVVMLELDLEVCSANVTDEKAAQRAPAMMGTLELKQWYPDFQGYHSEGEREQIFIEVSCVSEASWEGYCYLHFTDEEPKNPECGRTLPWVMSNCWGWNSASDLSDCQS